ncbi:hypothetical protein ACHAXA_002709 [Cyclostephanos tholiformis]|uniref:Uncharacterized protein n=1 Tax=Cyclostephanos tholiformis TaxID=382380 RepID=A0ABD3R6A6_9STRA
MMIVPTKMTPSTPSSPRSPRHFLEEPPLFIRILRLIIPFFATSLLLTTAYLFHMMHHNPSDDVSDLDNFVTGKHDGGEANSVGGAALRHKMDLANFLLKKYDQEQTDKGQREAMDLGGWKGGNEDNFIKLVKDIGGGGGEHGSETEAKSVRGSNGEASSVTKLTWQQLQQKLVENNLLPSPIPLDRTARGFSGLPPGRTPALDGSRRGHIHCNNTLPAVEAVLSSMLAFWNDPPGIRDRDMGYPNVEPHPFVAPPLSREEAKNPKLSRRRYLTFEPDGGGWNNLRISFECIVTFAAVMGRTLVLPPEQMVYLLIPRKNDTRKGRNFYDYYKLNTDLQRRVPIITSEEFLKLEGGEDGLVPLVGYNSSHQELLRKISRSCENRKVADLFCGHLYDHYLLHGLWANITTEFPIRNCFIFDVDVFNLGNTSTLKPEMKDRINKFCMEGADSRTPYFYNQDMHESKVVHFTTLRMKWRLLAHHYAFFFFTDPKIGNYYKRFVRDFLRYHDEMYCAAGKIILALQYEDYLRQSDKERSSSLNLDSLLVGGYSSLHIRRGDLQFKEVKIDSNQWYQNTKEVWKPNEILYIATDERNQSFFDDFRRQHLGPLRFFDDYQILAGIDSIDPTQYGMIETIVASRGSVFAGTWFSTFSGYIVRLRGYYGISKFYTYYSWLDRKYAMHHWADVGYASTFAREYPIGWTGIDGDVFVDNDYEGDRQNLMNRDEMDRLNAKAESKFIYNKVSNSRRLDENNTSGFVGQRLRTVYERYLVWAT